VTEASKRTQRAIRFNISTFSCSVPDLKAICVAIRGSQRIAYPYRGIKSGCFHAGILTDRLDLAIAEASRQDGIAEVLFNSAV